MRQVNKGPAPKKFGKYKEAEPYLEKRIGRYCSYCEMKWDNVPAVEHKISKSEGGDELAWNNLLLSCVYCNSRKGHKITPENKNDYLWPDEDETYPVFFYGQGLPVLNDEYLKMQTQEIRKRADNTYQLFQFMITPKTIIQDRRYLCRNEAYNLANKYLNNLQDHIEDRQEYVETIVDLAKGYGFFSIWMTIFGKESDIKDALVNAFPGTNIAYY